MNGTEPPAFISALKKLEEVLEDEKDVKKRLDSGKDDKKGKKAANKEKLRVFMTFRSKARKLFQEYEDRMKNFTEDKSESEESPSEASDSDSTFEEVDNPMQKKRQREQQKAAEKKKKEETEEWTLENIERKLEALHAERGKKTTNRVALVEKVLVILSHTGQWPFMTMKVLSHLLSFQMDLSNGLIKDMDTKLWRQCYDTITRLMNLMEENPEIAVVDTEDRVEEVGEERKIDDKKVNLISGLHQAVERLADEYTKSLQNKDPHTLDYVARLQDEAYLMDLIERVFLYYRSKGEAKSDVTCRMAIRLLDHLYYRRTPDHAKMLQKQRQLTFEKKNKKIRKVTAAQKRREDEDEINEEEVTVADKTKLKVEQFLISLDRRQRPADSELFLTEDLHDVILNLHKFVQQKTAAKSKTMSKEEAVEAERQKTKAILHYVYHLALHDQYSKARDLLLMSHRNAEHEEHQQFIDSIPLMVLYNRVVAQLGLAAFRAGELNDCVMILNELCAQQRMRDYLAQTVNKSRDRTELESQEKARLVPFHMHINVDLLDGVHLTAAMLIEVPNKAQFPHDTKRRTLSKSFQRLVTSLSHQVFLGPPETTKEIVYNAALALQKGDWKTCRDRILSLNLWKLMPNCEDVKEMIVEHIKVVGLRTYLFTYSQYYTTVQLGDLADRYELPEPKVHAVVSKIIIRQHMSAAWDQPKQCIRVEAQGATKLQYLALQLVDKCLRLAEYNEDRQTERENRRGKGDGGYQGRRQGGRTGALGKSWESGAAGAKGGARLGIKLNQTTDRKRTNVFAQRRWGR
eukprot:Sspe_Gene.3271::Locus_1073_Transcript_1_1_Confidence_1.000_Length_2932::g.3271::m.3271/K03252/EIF3C; translation initiation factor 3 subunit C